MKIFARVIHLLWLTTLCAIFGVASSLAGPSISLGGILFAYDGPNQGRIGYDGGYLPSFCYDPVAVPIVAKGANTTSGASILVGKTAEFLAAETTGIDSVRASYKALGIETSSTSTAASRGYTIYRQDGTLFKFGVTDADFVRMNESLKMAGPGSYARYTDIMPKYQAHLGEKYLRSLQYNSTGVWPLPGMKVPYPIDFTTQLPVPPQ